MGHTVHMGLKESGRSAETYEGKIRLRKISFRWEVKIKIGLKINKVGRCVLHSAGSE
jgi:hypothetical protein